MIVRGTTPAKGDLKHIRDYTERRFGPAQAGRAAMAIYEAADSLREMPQRGRSGRKSGTREFTVEGLPFLIV